MKSFASNVLLGLLTLFVNSGNAPAQDEVFSGPQVGEELAPFTVQGVFEDEGSEIDFVTRAGDRPIVLVFVHEVNRQTIAMTRILSGYTKSRAADGLQTGIIWLNDDATAAENELKRIKHALTPGAPTGISLEGREGPGSYGLNRNVGLTILVAKEGRVTGNFALIQPSLQADLPKILESIVAVAGGEIPKLEDLEGMQGPMRQAPGRPGQAQNAELNLRPLLAPVIRRDASVEDVDRAAQAVEERASQDPAVRREVGRIANTIIDAGKLENYGTPRAQEYLTKWAKEFGRPGSEKPDENSESPTKVEKER